MMWSYFAVAKSRCCVVMEIYFSVRSSAGRQTVLPEQQQY